MGLEGGRSNTTAGRADLPFPATSSSKGIGPTTGLLSCTDSDVDKGRGGGFNANSSSIPPSGSSEYAPFRLADLHR